MRRGEIRWLSLPGWRSARPVIVVSDDEFNDSLIPTVVCTLLTSNLRLAHAPGNVFLNAASTGLDRDAVANIAEVVSVDRRQLSPAAGLLGASSLQEIDDGLRLLLSL